MTLRVLQVIADTADSPANLAALRHHELLAANGIEIRTLALAPGSGRVVPRIVPTMAPSARSIAAYTQLRRELRWPDVAVAVDHLPRAMAGRSKVPVVAVSGAGSVRERLVARVADEAIVATVVVPTGDHDPRWSDDGTSRFRTPYRSGSASSPGSESSRRAARTELGVSGTGIVMAEIDPDSGEVTAIRVVRDGSLEDRRTVTSSTGRRSARDGDDHGATLELVVHAADVIVPSHEPSLRSSGAAGLPDALLPTIVDMMAAGVVPVGWPVALDKELLVVDQTAVVVDRVGNTLGEAAHGWTAAVESTLVALDGDHGRLRQLSSEVAAVTSRLCDPQVILGQWSQILDQALPSQT